MPEPIVNQNGHPEPANFRLPGFLVVHRRLRGDCPATWKSTVRLVALALAGHLDKNDMCYVRVGVVAAECGIGRRVVQRALRVLTADDAPLFVRETRANQSSVFRLVRHPAAFVEAREQVRSERRRKQLFDDMRKNLGVRRMGASKVEPFPAARKRAVRCPKCEDHAVLWNDGFLQDYYADWENDTGERTPHQCKARAPLPEQD